MTSVKEIAYAKINLHLDVLDRREDGFHSVRTVMHTVTLSDEITVSVKPSRKREITLSLVGGGKLPTDSRNLAYKAAETFLDATLIDAAVDIRLNKRIPVAAGLAGGSSDAAATLRALNRVYKKPLSEKRLLTIAAGLGSDVPFCLLGGTALCLGRGEIIERLQGGVDLHLVVAIADEHVSTPVAYSRLDELYGNFAVPRSDDADEIFASLMTSINERELKTHKLFNIFENAVLPICSGAEAIKQRMLDLGATHALMSGSGPSVFGIFENAGKAELAAEALKSEGYRAYTARSV